MPFATFDEWWVPFTLGVGPAGVYVAEIGEAQCEALALTASAWTVNAHS